MHINTERVSHSRLLLNNDTVFPSILRSSIFTSLPSLFFLSRVGKETENDFDEDFWSSLDLVANALDNVAARLYVDSKCVFHGKPLLESGTLGTKGNVQVIVPHRTEAYGASADPPDTSYPMCTLKYFPSTAEHVLQWARATFLNCFESSVELIAKRSAGQELNDYERAEIRESFLIPEIDSHSSPRYVPRSWHDCLVWAKCLFQRYFVNDIKTLLKSLPPNHLDSRGDPFWKPPRKCPKPIPEFDPNDADHVGFVVAAAQLRNLTLQLGPAEGGAAGTKVLASIEVPGFNDSPSSTGMVIPDENSDEDPNALSGAPDIGQEAWDQLDQVTSEQVVPIPFEKDDDLHMAFVHIASTLRAHCYGIKPTDLHRSRQIAGKIIPAMATTTSVVAGLACIELYKVVSHDSGNPDYKNSFVNLALPLFAFSEPLAPKGFASMGRSWTEWDFVALTESEASTVGDVINFLRDNFGGMTVEMLSYEALLLYAVFLPPAKMEARLEMSCREAIETLSSRTLPDKLNTLVLQVAGVDGEGEDIEDFPPIKYIFKNKD